MCERVRKRRHTLEASERARKEKADRVMRVKEMCVYVPMTTQTNWQRNGPWEVIISV